MSEIVHLAKTEHGVRPVFVWQPALVEDRRRSLNESTVGTLNNTIGFVPVWGSLIMADPQIFASCVELRRAIRVPSLTGFASQQLVDLLNDVGFRLSCGRNPLQPLRRPISAHMSSRITVA